MSVNTELRVFGFCAKKQVSIYSRWHLGKTAAMFQLVQDNIKEGQEAFFPSWKNEGTWKPFQMVSI